MLDRLKTLLGPIASGLMALYYALVINWTLAMSVLAGVGTAIWAWWEWSTRWGYLPVVLVASGAFVVALWGFNGIVWLRTRNRPSKTRMAFDYGYGLALEEVTPCHDLENDENHLEFRFSLRNHAPGPMRYKAERVDVVIGDRIRTVRDATAILPRGGHVMLLVGNFDKTTVESLGARTEGRCEFSIVYGHPDDSYSRRAKKLLRFTLVKRSGVVSAAPWLILSESDDQISREAI